VIKKIVVATTFVASMMVGVPAANASAGLCMAKYQEDLAGCGSNTACEMWADVMFAQCLEEQNAGIDPHPNG
jgi:hypothetical protein